MDDELEEIVDSPVERLEVEYKAYLDLGDAKHRADLARHIAALANYGGGHIVFGINDQGQPATGLAGLVIDHDVIAGITKKYLDPAVHCDVREVRSALGNKHPVVTVPPHGATPICARVNGPEINGKISGIIAGAYYLRKPGPESSQITSAADWRDVIRRCALHDRAAILTAISAGLIVGSVSDARPKAQDRLKAWADDAESEYRLLATRTDFATMLRECHVQFSYRIDTEDEEMLPSSSVVQTLMQVGGEVDAHVMSGWSLFHVFQTEELSPKWQIDPNDEEHEFYQANYLTLGRTFGFDLWRISLLGEATTLREYWEDTPEFGGTPKTELNSKIVARMLGELVWHAQALSSRFSSATAVDFRCRWVGLRGRSLHVRNAIPFHYPPTTVDSVTTSGRWAVGDLEPRIADIVAALGGKLGRAFGWNGFTEGWVSSQVNGWKQL